MNTLMFAASEAAGKMTVEFPNLFGGVRMTYSRSFNVFGLSIYWYGVLIAVGVILGALYMFSRATKDFGLVKDRVFDVTFVTLIGGFLFARIYYCVFTELKHPGSYTFVTMFTKIRDGGIAIYGGIIGAAIVGLLMCKLRKVKFFVMTDLASLGFLIGQTIGRWGNFINQEAYGAACDQNFPFAMMGSRISEEMGIGAHVHPCFLYESVWCLLGFIFLHIYSKKLRTFDGEISLLYLAWYGFGRFFIEQLRTDSLYAGGFKVSQWVGAVSFLAAVIVFVICKIRTKKNGTPLYVNTEASKDLIALQLEQEQKEKERKAEKKARKAEKQAEDDEEKDENGEDSEEPDKDGEELDNDSEDGEEPEETETAEDTETTEDNESKENDDDGKDN